MTRPARRPRPDPADFMPLTNCDCGACCEECGHYEDCISHDPDPQPTVSIDDMIANARPGSFLEFLLGGDR